MVPSLGSPAPFDLLALSDPIPLFGPVPGGMEIIVILLVMMLMFGVPLVLLGGGLYVYRESKSDQPAGEELAALRQEVRALREEVEQLDDDEK
ncbi:FtsB family cell division protein [Halorussus litoreus]|uniref:FtsB family cell division protein n=1 Tax=Halorussus litoreus TaxID=1710536 RepID=UPI000E2747AA|nr:hypothetical protein [Halorussus litoreus]